MSTDPASAVSSPTPPAILSPRGSWVCPLQCGQRYKRSSGRSIRRHVNLCFRTHNPSTASLTDEQLSAVISEQQASGRLVTGLRRWKMRRPRRQAQQLSDDDRWDCTYGCGKSYRATSSRSMQRHANRCALRPAGQTGDVDVKQLLVERSHEPRKMRRTLSITRMMGSSGSDSGIEDGSSHGGSTSPSHNSYLCHHTARLSQPAVSMLMPAASDNSLDAERCRTASTAQNVLWDAAVGGAHGGNDKLVQAQLDIDGELSECLGQQQHQPHHSQRATLFPPSPCPQPVAPLLQAQAPFRSPSPVSSVPAVSQLANTIFDEHAYNNDNNSALSTSHSLFVPTNSPLPWQTNDPSASSVMLNVSQPQQPTNYPTPVHNPAVSPQYTQPAASALHQMSRSSPSLASALNSFSSTAIHSSHTPLASSLLTSTLLAAADYRSLYEREQLVSDQLRTLVTSLYSTYGLQHAALSRQQGSITSQLIQQAVNNPPSAVESLAAARMAPASTFATPIQPSAPRPITPEHITPDWVDEYSAALSRYLQTAAASPASSAV